MAYITLSKSNFFNNLDIISKQAGGKERVALVLKDNAYGHGLEQMAELANRYGITKAVVRCEVEAKMIENLFEYILVLAHIPNKASQKIRYTINDIDDIKKFPKDTLVELKIDTGMHRNGVSMDEFEKAISLIKTYKLRLDGIFTHHRSADELSSEWFWQNENFKIIKQKAKEMDLHVKFHSASSASLFRYDNFNEDMARVGIAAYGCMDLHVEGLRPVLSLYAQKISSRNLKKGECVGYGATYTADKDCVVSNYDIGYGDGFFRILSNNFYTPNNKRLVGRISMDNSSFLADENELLIFNDAREVAKKANTISYEILTSLKHYMQRVITS